MSALAGLDTSGLGLMLLMSFICFARLDIVSIIIIRSSKICTIQRDTRTFCFISHLSACNKKTGQRTSASMLASCSIDVELLF